MVVKEHGDGRVVHFAAAGNASGRPFLEPSMQRLLVNAARWAGIPPWLGASPVATGAKFGAAVLVLDEVRKAGIAQVSVETVTSTAGK